MNGLNMENPTKTFFTVEELAKFLSISRASLYRLINKRQFSFYKIGGNIRFRKKDVDEYLEKIRIKPITM